MVCVQHRLAMGAACGSRPSPEAEAQMAHIEKQWRIAEKPIASYRAFVPPSSRLLIKSTYGDATACRANIMATTIQFQRFIRSIEKSCRDMTSRKADGNHRENTHRRAHGAVAILLAEFSRRHHRRRSRKRCAYARRRSRAGFTS